MVGFSKIKYSEMKFNDNELEQAQRLVYADEYETNIQNFNITDERLLNDIFEISCELTQYAPTFAYDFDHISYSLLAWVNEHKTDEVNELIKTLKTNPSNEEYQYKVWKIVEIYNDLESDFEEGRVNGN